MPAVEAGARERPAFLDAETIEELGLTAAFNRQGNAAVVAATCWQKVQKMAAEYIYRHVGDGVFEVSKKNQPEYEVYHVSVVSRSCTCLAWKDNADRFPVAFCKHLLWVVWERANESSRRVKEEV